jgi:hypothetical protein
MTWQAYNSHTRITQITAKSDIAPSQVELGEGTCALGVPSTTWDTDRGYNACLLTRKETKYCSCQVYEQRIILLITGANIFIPPFT